MSNEVVLLISPVSAPTSEKNRLEKEVGAGGRVFWTRSADLLQTAFSDNYFYKIVSIGSRFDHSADFLNKINSLLKAGGVFELKEPISTSLQNIRNGIRTEEELKGELILSGFLISNVQNMGDENDNIATFSVIAKKPNYELGSASLLKTRETVKVNNQNNKKPSVWSIDDDDAVADLPPVTQKEKIWSIDTVDQFTDSMVDEDLLLEEEDKVMPTYTPSNPNDDCEVQPGRRGACKNCTCGRAEQIKQLGSSPTSTAMINDVKSSCGNCYLGDAFRCSTCPFLGKPAFKPGDRVMIDLS